MTRGVIVYSVMTMFTSSQATTNDYKYEGV